MRVTDRLRTDRIVFLWLALCGSVPPASGIELSDDAYVLPPGEILLADGAGGNPPGAFANDLDVTGLPADRVYVAEGPKFGSLQFNGDGTFNYTPDPAFLGEDAFVYAVIDPTDAVVVDGSTPWKYLHPLDGRPPDEGDADFDETWHTPGFDDSQWSDGVGVMGYGELGTGEEQLAIETDIGTPPGARFGAYFRTSFSAPSPGSYSLHATFVRDDAAIFYLNGVELARSFESASPLMSSAADDHFLIAGSGHGAGITTGPAETAEQVLSLRDVHLVEGGNTLAVSLRNGAFSNALNSSDLGLSVNRMAISPTLFARVRIQVGDGGVAPLPRLDAFSVEPGAVLDSALLGRGLFDNDGFADVAGQPLPGPFSASFDTGSLSGTLEAGADAGGFRFTPAPGFEGLTSFRYRIDGPGGSSGFATVKILVDPAVATLPGELSLSSGSSAEFNLPFPDGAVLGVGQPAPKGAVELVEETDGLARISYVSSPDRPFSGVDRVVLLMDSPPVIPAEVSWRYLWPEGQIDPDTTDPDFDQTWYTPGYDDTGWAVGTGLVGYGLIGRSDWFGVQPIDTQLEGRGLTCYLRTSFEVGAGYLSWGELELRGIVEDGAIIYINGVEIGRIPEGLVGVDDYSLSAPGTGSNEGAVSSVRFPSSVLQPGQNTLAVSLHNDSPTNSDIGFRLDGVYRVGAFDEFPVSVVVVSPFETWRREQFDQAALDDLTISGAAADPDRDGLVNVVEYYLRFDPMVANSSRPGRPYPLYALDETPSGRYPILSHWWLDPALDLQIEAQRLAEGSKHWTTVGVRYPGEPWVTPGGRQIAGLATPVEELGTALFRFRFRLMPWVTDVPAHEP